MDIGQIFSDFVSYVKPIFQDTLNSILRLLPHSPFREFIDSMDTWDFLGVLNWLFPVGTCLTIMADWLLAIGLFYVYSVVMRWLKVIGD